MHLPSLHVPDGDASTYFTYDWRWCIDLVYMCLTVRHLSLWKIHYLWTVSASKHRQLSGWLPGRQIVHQQRYRYIDRGDVDFNIVCKMRFGNFLHQVWAGNPNNSNSRAKIYYMYNTAYDKYKHRELLKMYPNFWDLYFAAKLYRSNQFC